MPRPDRLRIAYLCDASPLDRNLYSGGNARLFDALQKHAGDVTILDNGWHMAEPLRRALLATPDAFNLRARWRLHLALSRIIARGVEAELRRGQYDVLFGAYAFYTLRHVQAPKSTIVAFTSDATQTIYRESLIGQTFDRKIPGGALLDGWVERAERAVFQSCDLLLWPSTWLKDAADARYGLADEQSAHVPWGANLDPVPPPGQRHLSPDADIELLLIGRDWFAKGGPLAFETLESLRKSGTNARLTVIGCTPPDVHRNAAVTVYPQLDKAVPVELAVFQDALARAHFLIQPSFESYGFAFCEASAYGLPALCLAVGGIPVRNGINGHALPIGSTAADFAAIIQDYTSQPETYAALAQSSRQEYEARLNWDAWGQQAASLLRKKWDDMSQ